MQIDREYLAQLCLEYERKIERQEEQIGHLEEENRRLMGENGQLCALVDALIGASGE